MDLKKNKLSGLKLTRRIGEIIDITMGDNNVEVQVSEIKQKYVKLIINAPDDININRRELTIKKNPDNWGNR